ncbi:MAG: hypothetical protein JWL63_1471 [Rhodocyclales bacterium]|nr:hypothetical protein [Rhodocyclales bacterium]
MKNGFLIFSFLFALLSGCAATGPQFSPVSQMSPGNGVIYIYRPDAGANRAIAPGIKVDGREYSTLRNNGYMPFELAAGEHEIDVVLSDRYKGEGAIKLRLRPQTEMYLRLSTSYERGGGMIHRQFRLEGVNSEVGSVEIQTCKLEDPNADRRSSKSVFIDN